MNCGSSKVRPDPSASGRRR